MNLHRDGSPIVPLAIDDEMIVDNETYVVRFTGVLLPNVGFVVGTARDGVASLMVLAPRRKIDAEAVKSYAARNGIPHVIVANDFAVRRRACVPRMDIDALDRVLMETPARSALASSLRRERNGIHNGCTPEEEEDSVVIPSPSPLGKRPASASASASAASASSSASSHSHSSHSSHSSRPPHSRIAALERDMAELRRLAVGRVDELTAELARLRKEKA